MCRDWAFREAKTRLCAQGTDRVAVRMGVKQRCARVCARVCVACPCRHQRLEHVESPCMARPVPAPERTALESGQSQAVLAARPLQNDLCGLPPPYPSDEETEAQGRKATRSRHALSRWPRVGLMTITTTIATPKPAAVSGLRLHASPRGQASVSAGSSHRHDTPKGHAVTVPTLQMKQRDFRQKWGAGGPARSTCHLPGLLADLAPDYHLSTSLRPLRKEQTLMVRRRLWKSSPLAGVGGI